MKELKPGDRVRVFVASVVVGSGGEERAAGDSFDAAVVSVSADAVQVDDGGGLLWAHRYQVRKLVKKARRRIWISASAFENGVSSHKYVALEPSLTDGIEFVEVRKKVKP